MCSRRARRRSRARSVAGARRCPETRHDAPRPDRLSALAPPLPGAAAAADERSPGTAAAPGASCASTGATACATPAPPHGDPEADALAAALAAPHGPAVVELVSRDCPVCARMRPVVAEARRHCAGKVLRFDQREVESALGAAVARSHAIRGVPTFLLLDERGVEVGRLVGEQTLAALERAMRDLTGGRCAQDPGARGT